MSHTDAPSEADKAEKKDKSTVIIWLMIMHMHTMSI